MNLRHFFHRLIKHSSATYDEIAQFANFRRDEKTSAQTMTNKFNPTCNTHFANLNDCQAVLEMLDGWQALAEYAAEKANCVVVGLPPADLSDTALLDTWLLSDEKRGMVSATFRTAYEDGVIDEREFVEIERAVLKEVAAVLAFLRHVERVKGE